MSDRILPFEPNVDNIGIYPYILDREAREGRPLGSSLPHVIVNDPYRTVIPPLTQQEIRQ
ncbi:unnamed protein product, partial [Rotaria socialis]